jgi:hypothetical protein
MNQFFYVLSLLHRNIFIHDTSTTGTEIRNEFRSPGEAQLYKINDGPIYITNGVHVLL